MNVSASTRYHDRLKKKRQAIHVARRQLDLDDTAYRALLQRVAGVKSSADIMSHDKADAVLDALSKLGFKHKRSRPGKPDGSPATLDREPYLQKIEALLADMKLPWAYIHRSQHGPTMVKRLTGKDRIEWADAAGKQAVITALVKRQQKALGA